MSIALTADFRQEPYIHQLREFELNAEKPARALFWQMRTGKSKTMIDTACHLASVGKIDIALVIAPNGVHENWATRELPKHHWHSLKYFTCLWMTEETHDGEWWLQAQDAYKTIAERDLTWFCFSANSIIRPRAKGLIRKLLTKKVLVIWDECQDYRSPGSKRAKFARSVSRKCEFKRILTGTPVDNSPLHAWGQLELLGSGTSGFKTHDEFKQYHAVYATRTVANGRSYPELVEYRNLEILKGRIDEVATIINREDCPDLPPLIRSERLIDISADQKEAYRSIQKELLLELQPDPRKEPVEVTVDGAARITKLQQILSGFVYDNSRKVHAISRNAIPRLEAVADEVRKTTGKVVIWCRFQPDVRAVTRRLQQDGWKVEQYYGKTSAKDKARVRKIFAGDADSETDVKAVVGYPAVGIDLSAASKIIWYSHIFDAVIANQADERATAMGGAAVEIVDFKAPKLDQYILDNRHEKKELSDAMLASDLVKLLEYLAF